MKLQGLLDSVQAPPPSKFLRVEVIFGAIHLIALIAAVYAIAWTATWDGVGKAPKTGVWLPMVLFTMGYPMVPIIFGCWMLRAFERCKGSSGRRMTAGYYFNNLKMGLLPSLGYGFFVNFIFKKGIKMMTKGNKGLEVFLDLLGPVAWVFGVLGWWGVSHCIDTGEEARRPDFGFYPRWRVERGRQKEGGPSPPLEEMLHKGPHMFLRIIPTPTHGTLTKIMKASLARMIGISLLASLLWFSGVLWFLVDEDMKNHWNSVEEGHSAEKIILCTEMLDLIVNTCTAPLIIAWGWRSEPHAPAAAEGASTPTSEAEALVLPFDDEATERAELLKELWNDLA